MKKIAIFLIIHFSITGSLSDIVHSGSQYWNTTTTEVKLGNKTKFKFEEEFRFQEPDFKFYYHHSDLGLSYKFYEWLDLGLNYRQIYEKKNVWEEERRPHLNANLKWQLANFKFENRHRVEYRAKEQNSSWRYRNRLAVKFPSLLYKVNSYIADEIFYGFDTNSLTRNRLYLGSELKLGKNLGIDIFYLLQSNKSGSSWENSNIIGSKLKF